MKLTKIDVIKYLNLIRLNFENAYPFKGDDLDLLASTWTEILSKYPKEACDHALKNALSKATFAPRIGDIVAECEILTNPHKSDQELWAELMDLKYTVYDESRYLQYPQHRAEAERKLAEIFDGLDPDLKAYLVNVNGLVDFAVLTQEDLPYEKNRFFRNMPDAKRHSSETERSKKFMELVGNNLLQIDDKK